MWQNKLHLPTYCVLASLVLHTLEWFSCIHEVAVSLQCNMWRFYGASDLTRKGIKKWKWQVPW